MNEKNKSIKKRRKNGEGRVETLPSGSKRIKLTVKDNQGNFKTESFTGKTVKEAEMKRDAFYKLMEEVEEWMYTEKIIDLREASFARLKSTYDVNIFPEIGHLKLCEIDSSMLQNLINSKIKNLSYSSIKKMYNALNNFYKSAVAKRQLGINWMNGVKLPKEEKCTVKTKKIEIIADERIPLLEETALTLFKNGKLMFKIGPAIILLLQTGLRLGELLALQWEDIDFEEKIIKVNKTVIKKVLDKRDPTLTDEEIELINVGRKNVYKIQLNAKSKTSDRTLKLNQKSIDMLKLLRECNKNYVVETRNGDFVLPYDFEKSFKRVLRRTGIPQMGVHSTRHTFATKLIRSKKVPLRVISRILGHNSEKVTRDTYIHICPKELAEAFEVVENLYDDCY